MTMTAIFPLRHLLQSNPAVRNIYHQALYLSVRSIIWRLKYESNVLRTYITHVVNQQGCTYNRQCSKRGGNRSFQASVSSSAQFCSKRLVLGIETSCDDTGAAIVDEEGNVLAEALHSQTAAHNE